jgi:hypothetical protein
METDPSGLVGYFLPSVVFIAYGVVFGAELIIDWLRYFVRKV